VGAAGDDRLTGGSGIDTFACAVGFGRDRITDFDAASRHHDIIQFETSVFSTYAQVRAACHQVGTDVVITASSQDSLTLMNVSLSQLTPDDFSFV
jgi:Ca2+-binding RTX toxin-like protein